MDDERNKSNGGWVKIYRSIQNNCFWNEKPFSKGQAWIDLILLAKHQDEKFTDRYGKVIDGKRGCIYMSESAIKDRWGWSRKKVDNFLSQLECEKEIKILKKSTTEGTIIFIVNYDKFQSQRTSKRTTQAQREHNASTTQEHIQERKEGIKKEKRISTLLSSDDDAVDDDEKDVIDLGTMTDDEFERWEAKHHGTI